jgi:hypothetical protein
MFAQSAACAFIGNHRILASFKDHCLPLDRTAFVTTPAQQFPGPCKTFFTVKLSKTHADIINIHIVEGIRWTDGTAAHTEITGSFFGINFRRSSQKKIKPSAHFNAIENTHLRALAALQTAGEEFFFTAGPRWAKKIA